MKVNGESVDRLSADESVVSGGHGDGTVSSTVLWKLRERDRVWVEALAGREYSIYGDFHSQFSGALLSAE